VVRAAPGRVVQVVDNLVANALEAARSRVVVQVRGNELRVVDDGPGMSDDEKARAFDRFWTTRADGSGLGLAIVRRLVETDGGRVSLRDAPGGGLEAAVALRPT
jgi:signal transduction histidine kinase